MNASNIFIFPWEVNAGIPNPLELEEISLTSFRSKNI